MTLTNEEVLKIFSETEALLNGHFLLTSGRHSNVYFQCAKVLQHPKYTKLICSNLVEHFKDMSIETVIAPAMGGLIVGYEIARQLNARFIFTEREDKIMQLRRGFSLQKNERVLICEDVVTTGGSVFEVIDIVKKFEAEIVGVAYIVDRSNGKVNFGYEQKSVLALDAVSFPADDCKLCNEAIPLVKPGSRKVLSA
ncbi:MAG: orotate phosphoribosyltransferase [Ignavibacteria bacterium]|jgi:orotate phosphoribosyltransferase|nr:orotate phosphoribosyltransferase [Ignavibacteria bacterium]MDP3830165.1 orotate phosphoribosyltransferase [Ignavibacteriaceae bacterium]